MVLRLRDKWIWDFWFAQDGSDYHIFYLQASRSLRDERLRHWHVSIGHALSQDLMNWQILPDALGPSVGDEDAFDSFTTWTGSIIRSKGEWYLFYTGSKEGEQGRIQRIGLATSSDLIRWIKHTSNPLIEADACWYELFDLELWHEQAWRDPWVFYYEGAFHALITARANHGSIDGRGVIAHAQSLDLIHWEVLPPLTEPGEFGYMEVPQLIVIKDGFYLLFSCGSEMLSTQGRNRFGKFTGTYYLYAESALGPFRYINEKPFLVYKNCGFYSAKIIHGPDDKLYLLAFMDYDESGTFIGEITDPMPVQIAMDRQLIIEV